MEFAIPKWWLTFRTCWTEFCESDQLFKIHDSANRLLTDVGEMLLESDPIYGPAPSFDRERQVRKHIGDYALFFAGMFPESINHFRLRHQRLENFVEWMKAGKRKLLHRLEIRAL